MSKSSDRSLSLQSLREQRTFSHISHVQVFRALSPQSLGQQRTFKVMSVMPKPSGLCLRSLSDSEGPSRSCQPCPSLQGSVSAVSLRAKVMSVMSKSSRICLRSLSESKGPSKSCPSLQRSVSAVSRGAKDRHTAQLRVCRGFRNVCSVLPLR